MSDITYDPDLAAAEAANAAEYPVTWTVVGVLIVALLNICYCKYYNDDYKRIAGY